MGQRLNIEITDGSNVLANAYYHWSAYTHDSAELLKLILSERCITDDSTMSIFEKAIYLLERTGAGFSSTELDYIKNEDIDLPLDLIKFAKDRNEGLIAISTKGIKDTEYWEEGRLTVDILNLKVDFNVVWAPSDEEAEDYEKDGAKLSLLPYDIRDMSFRDAFAFIEFVNDKYDNSEFYIFRSGDTYYVPIE